MSLRPAVAAVVLAAVMFGAIAPYGEAYADTPDPLPSQPRPNPPAAPAFFLGAIAGNGNDYGVEGGVRVAPHVALGLQGGRFADARGSGFGIGPLLRLSLGPQDGPYVALGASWFTIAADATNRASGTAVLAGVGYEWRPLPQFSLLAGLGAAFVPGVSVDRGGVVTPAAGGLKPNYELGLRWYAF